MILRILSRLVIFWGTDAWLSCIVWPASLFRVENRGAIEKRLPVNVGSSHGKCKCGL